MGNGVDEQRKRENEEGKEKVGVGGRLAKGDEADK